MICTWGGVIILVLSGKRYCHQIEMISVIKMETCFGLLLAALAIISRTCIV
jgi:hypothetical protein